MILGHVYGQETEAHTCKTYINVWRLSNNKERIENILLFYTDYMLKCYFGYIVLNLKMLIPLIPPVFFNV